MLKIWNVWEIGKVLNEFHKFIHCLVKNKLYICYMRNLLVLLSVFITTLGFSQNKLDSLVFNHINEYRGLNGIELLQWDTITYKVAQNHSTYIITTLDCSHDQTMENNSVEIDTIFRNRFRKFGVSDGSYIGENITLFWGTETMDVDEIACETFQNWVDSPEHHELLLDDVFKYGAISHSTNKNVIKYYIDEYGDFIEHYFGDMIAVSFECRD